MPRRRIALVAFGSFFALAACSSDSPTVTALTNTSTVRFINATNGTISVVNDSSTDALNANLAFGGGSTCIAVNNAKPSLVFKNVNGTAMTGFLPSFANGGNYTVIAYADANGNVQFTTLDNTYTATSGQAGVRVFNAAAGSGDVMVSSNGSPLNNGLVTSFGNASAFFSAPAGSQTLAFSTAANPTATASSTVTLNAGQITTVVLGPAATGSTALRSFVATRC